MAQGVGNRERRPTQGVYFLLEAEQIRSFEMLFYGRLPGMAYLAYRQKVRNIVRAPQFQFADDPLRYQMVNDTDKH